MSTASTICPHLTRAKSASEVTSRITVFTDKLTTLAARVQSRSTILPDRSLTELVRIANTLRMVRSWSTETRASLLAGTSRPSKVVSTKTLGGRLVILRFWSKKVYVQKVKMEVSQTAKSIGTLIKAVSNPKQISRNLTEPKNL